MEENRFITRNLDTRFKIFELTITSFLKFLTFVIVGFAFLMFYYMFTHNFGGFIVFLIAYLSCCALFYYALYEVSLNVQAYQLAFEFFGSLIDKIIRFFIKGDLNKSNEIIWEGKTNEKNITIVEIEELKHEI